MTSEDGEMKHSEPEDDNPDVSKSDGDEQGLRDPSEFSDVVDDILKSEAAQMGVDYVPDEANITLTETKEEGDEGNEDEESEYYYEEVPFTFEDHLAQAVAVLKPVALTMILVVLLVQLLNPKHWASTEVGTKLFEEGGSSGVSSGFNLFDGIPGLAGLGISAIVPIWAIIIVAFVNAIIFVVMIVFVTFVLVLLFYFRCMKLIYGWLVVSSGMLLSLFGGYTLYSLLVVANVPMDVLTFAILLANFGLCGVVSIFWRAPKKIKQIFLILVSVLLANSFTMLPDWTVWALLAIVACYDIFAVLAPKGPLKMLVHLSQKRGQPIPGLLYEVGMASPIVGEESFHEESEKAIDIEEHERLEPPQTRSVKLGLGDFVFYSVLVARAALYDSVTVVSCFIAVLMGLVGTLMLLNVLKRALPALPFSIFAGIFFYYVTRWVIVPYLVELGLAFVFI